MTRFALTLYQHVPVQLKDGKNASAVHQAPMQHSSNEPRHTCVTIPRPEHETQQSYPWRTISSFSEVAN